jgi:hypothetical protein
MSDKSRQPEMNKVAAAGPEYSQQKLVVDPSIIENLLEDSEEQVTADPLVWELRYLQNFVERLRTNHYLLCVSGLHLRQLVDLGESSARVEGLVADWGLFVLDDAQQVIDRLAWSDQDLIAHTISLCRLYHCSLATDRSVFFEGTDIELITPARLKVVDDLERLFIINLGRGDERSVNQPALIIGQPEPAQVGTAPRGLRFKWTVWVVSLLILLENLNSPESEFPGPSQLGPNSPGPKTGPDQLGPGFSGPGSTPPRAPQPKPPDSGAEAAENADSDESPQATDLLERAPAAANKMANVVQDLINSLKATVQQVFESNTDRAVRTLALQAMALAIVLDSKAALAENLPGLAGPSGEAGWGKRPLANNSGPLQSLLQGVIQSVGSLGEDPAASNLVNGMTRGADRGLDQSSILNTQNQTLQQTPSINLATNLPSSFPRWPISTPDYTLALANPVDLGSAAESDRSALESVSLALTNPPQDSSAGSTGTGSTGAGSTGTGSTSANRGTSIGNVENESSTSTSTNPPNRLEQDASGRTQPDQSVNSLKDINLPKAGANPAINLPIINQPDPPSSAIWSKFDSGVYTVDASGQVSIDYLYDGGLNQGELGIFDLDQMDLANPNAFVNEAIRRVLSNSKLGHIVLSDATEGAKFSGQLLQETIDYNFGTYKGVQKFTMTPGSHFGMILFSNSTFESVWNQTSSEQPIFSLMKGNGNALFQNVQMVSLTDDRSVVTIEDISLDGPSDQDYNDLVIRVGGATNNLSTRNLPEVSQKVLAPGSTLGDIQGLNPTPANGATSASNLANDDPFRADRAGVYSAANAQRDSNQL